MNKRHIQTRLDDLSQLQTSHALQTNTLTDDLNTNLAQIRLAYQGCFDVVFHEFIICHALKAVLIYIQGLVDMELLDRQVLTPLQDDGGLPVNRERIRELIAVSQLKETDVLEDTLEEISSGKAALLVQGEGRAILIGSIKWERRGIEEPSAETVVRGSREGFSETLLVNTALIRRRIKSPALKLKTLKIGRYSRTDVVIAYLDGIADPALVDEVENRLNKIEIDGILESGQIEELIEDNSFSPFPQLLSTERTDTAVSYILEGRVVIVTEGTPFVMIAPITLATMLQSPEDYYQRAWAGTVIRWLRYLFFIISLVTPSLYVSFLTFHQDMIPSTLLLSIAKSRENIPFPALIEALLMETTFEALREAGIRLPKQVGAAVSIVGALVIGQAATAAGIVSAPMVIIVAITGIASFTVPRYAAGISLRLLRFPLMIISGALGLLGLTLCMILIMIHLCKLRSFGVPYMAPLAPLKRSELKDVLARLSIKSMKTRPLLTQDKVTYRIPERETEKGQGRGEQ